MATQTFSIKLTANGKEVIELQNALKEKANEYEKQLDEINKKLQERDKLTEEEIKDLEKQSNSLAAKIKALGTAVEENITKLRTVDTVLKNLAGSSGSELGKALKGLGQKFKQVSDQTLKAGETMEGKLIEIKEKTIEVRHEMSKRDGIDAMKRARATMQDLVNTPTDKLKMGLDSIEKKLLTMSDAEKQAADGMTLLQARSRYKAQLAVNEYGRAGTADIAKMNADQLRAEQARLRSAYTATDGAQGYETISQEYLTRLQAVNQALAEKTKLEREAATAAENSKKLADVMTRLNANQKVSIQELTEAQKIYEQQLKQMQGTNLTPADQQAMQQTEQNLQRVKQALTDISQIDVQKTIDALADPNAKVNLEQMEAALKQLKENASQIDIKDDDAFRQYTEDVQQLELAIAQVKDKMQGIADIDFDNLSDVPTEKLEAALKRIEEDEKKLKATDSDTARTMAENKRKLQTQIAKNRQAVQDYAHAEKVAGETGKHSVTELKAAYETLQQKLMSLNTNQKRDIEQTRQQMKQLKQAIDETSGSVTKQNSIWQTAVKNITAYVGVFGMFNFVKSGIQKVIRGGEELSDQMAQVRMVSGLAMEDIEELTRRLAKLDTRTTLQELTQLSYAGAKLGFGEKGIKGLEDFVSAANQVNVALREDLGEEALTALSKITENMGLIKKMGVEDAMLATSSAMFKLAATSTAAAGPIVEVTKRLAPVAQMSGFAAHEILALASASDSLQLMPEVVGTALSKLIMAMQNNHNLIEKYLTIPEGTIASMFKAGKSMDALMLVFEKMSGKNVTELDGLWKLLGSDGQRLITVVADMANHTDTLAKHLDTSTKAFKEATAVTEEYNIQQETAMAYLLRAENLWRNAFINPDSSLSVKEMTKAWYDFTKSILDSDFAMGSIKVTVDFLLLSIRALIQLLPMIAFGLMAKGAALLVDKMKLAKIATDGFATSWKKMDAATKSNWIGLIVGGLVQLVFWTKEWISSTSDAEKEQKKLNQAIEAMHEKQDQEISNLSRLKKQLDDTNISQEERNALLSKVKSDYDIYLNYLGIEKNAVDDLTKHYDALVKVMKQRFAYEEREEYKRDVMGGEEGLRMKRRKAGSDLSKYGNTIGVDADLELIQTYAKGGKSAKEIMTLMFPDVKANELNALRSRPSGSATYATPGAASAAANDYDKTFGNFRKYVEGYVASIKAELDKEAEIDAAFAAEIGDFDYDKWLRTQVTGEFKVQPDKAALAAAKKADQEAKEALRKDLQDAKQESDAIISKIEEWYRLQETVITDMAADGRLTQEQAEQVTRTLNIAKNTALRDARLAISGRDTEAWEQTKQQIGDLMLDQGQWSLELLEQILNVSMDAIRNNLARIDAGGGQYGITTTALKDAVDKNAAGNQREIARILNQGRQEVEKLLQKYEYFDQAARQFASNLTQIGVLGVTAEQMANDMNSVPNAQQTVDAAKSMLAAILRQGTSIYAVNPADAKAVAEMIRNATTEAMTEADYLAGRTSGQQAHWFDLFPEVKDWMENPDQHKKELENFFNVVLIAEQDYYGNRKQSYETAKKQQENRSRAAGWTDQEERIDKYYDNQSKMQDAGIGASFWQQQGLGSIAQDPEVLAIQNRIYWRQKDVESAQARLASINSSHEQEIQALLDFQQKEMEALIQHNATQQEQDDLRAKHEQKLADLRARQAAERMGLEDLLHENQTKLFEQEIAFTTKLAQELKSRVQTINSLTKPIQDAATNVGKKFGEMIRGAEEESMTWNEIWKSMAAAVAESTIDMMAQYAQNLIMEKSLNAQHKQEAIDKATVDVAAGTASAAAKTLGTLGWWGIALIPVIAALLKGLLNEALASNKSSESTTASSSSATKTKLVSGMLTYDRGNLSTVHSPAVLGGASTVPARSRSGKKRYLGDDGRVYLAEESPAPKDGLVTRPIATTVQGQPALVAERGPEIVIGRETTRAIMLNEPELIRYIANYDRAGGHAAYSALRAYDSGTVPATLAPVPAASPAGSSTAATVPDGSPSGNSDRIAAALDQNTQMMAAFIQMMNGIQQKGIPAHINKYGTGGLIDEVKSGLKFDKRYNG